MEQDNKNSKEATGKKCEPAQTSGKPKTKKPSRKTIFKHTQSYQDIKAQKGSDGLMRMSFLYRIAEKHRKEYPQLSWKYMYDLNQVSEKLVIRTDNVTKQDICKICRGILPERGQQTDDEHTLNDKANDIIKRVCEYCGEPRTTFLKPKHPINP